MKIGETVKKLLLITAVCGIVLMVFSQLSFGQIVYRSIWRQSFISREYRPRYNYPYENFGNYDLRRYPPGVDPGSRDPVTRGAVTPVSFDQFGNFLLPGGEIYTMSWNKSRIGTSEWADPQWAGSGSASGVFNQLMIWHGY